MSFAERKSMSLKLLNLILTLLIVSVAIPSLASPKIQTRAVEYRVKGKLFQGFLALPEGEKPVPGVLVIHEWWGHNEYARNRAKMLAEMGYAAFALDMYGKGKSAGANAKHAEHLMSEAVNSGEIKERFDGALQVLLNEKRVQKDDVAAIGYCFGGNVVLSMAAAGAPLKAVASFHGSIPAHQELKSGVIKSEVFIAQGGADPFVATDKAKAFQEDLEKAGAKVKMVVYPNAKHGFTDKEASQKGKSNHLPLEYNEAADKESWEELRELLKRVFSSAA